MGIKFTWKRAGQNPTVAWRVFSKVGDKSVTSLQYGINNQ